MALPYLKVVGVMSRRDLHRSGPEFLVYIVVCHNGDFPVHQGKHHMLADDVLVPLILRVYRDSRIAQHGLRTGRGNLQKILRSYNRVLDMPEMSALLLMLHLGIGQGGLADRTPIDDPGSLVDISLFI